MHGPRRSRTSRRSVLCGPALAGFGGQGSRSIRRPPGDASRVCEGMRRILWCWAALARGDVGVPVRLPLRLPEKMRQAIVAAGELEACSFGLSVRFTAVAWRRQTGRTPLLTTGISY